MVSIDDMDKFEQKEMKKIRPIKNSWYEWLTDYIHKPTTKSVGGFKDKVIILFKTNTPKPKQTVHGRGKKQSKLKAQIKIRNSVMLKKKKKEIKESIIGDIWTL